MEISILVAFALIAVLAAFVCYLFIERRDDEERFIRHLSNIRPQSFNPDSAYIYESPPRWQFDIISDDLGGSTLLGHGWRYEDWLVTCMHVVKAAQEKSSATRKVYIRHTIIGTDGKRRTCVKDVSDCQWFEKEADLALTRYEQKEFPYMPSAKVKAVVQPQVAKIATSFPQDNASIGTIEPFKFGVLAYNGSTRGGFSGATYVVGGKVVAMHLAGGITNLAYAATYIANLVKKNEDSSDEVLKRMMEGEDEIEYDEVTPDEVQVHFRGQYYMYDRGDFFRELHSRKTLRSRRADRSILSFEPETGSEKRTQIASTQTTRGLGVVSSAVQCEPRTRNASTQSKARIILERGPDIPMEVSKAPVLKRSPGGVVMEYDDEPPQLLPVDLEDQLEEQLEAAEAFTTDDEDDFEPRGVRPSVGIGSENCELPARDQLTILAGSISVLTDHMQQLAVNMSQVPSLEDWNQISAAIRGLREEQKQLQIRFDHTFRDMEKRVMPPPIDRRLFNLESSTPSSTRLVLTSQKLPKQPEPKVERKGGSAFCAPLISAPAQVSASLETIKQSVKHLAGTDLPVQTRQPVSNSGNSSMVDSGASLIARKSKRRRRSAKRLTTGPQELATQIQ